MAKFYHTKEFKDLQKVWEEKLFSSGFSDAEQRMQNPYRHSPSRETREGKLEYFRTITECIHSNLEINPLDLTVMTMRGDGFTNIQIAKEIGAHRKTVMFIIRRYEHRWGLRVWSLKQRNLLHD